MKIYIKHLRLFIILLGGLGLVALYAATAAASDTPADHSPPLITITHTEASKYTITAADPQSGLADGGLTYQDPGVHGSDICTTDADDYETLPDGLFSFAGSTFCFRAVNAAGTVFIQKLAQPSNSLLIGQSQTHASHGNPQGNEPDLSVVRDRRNRLSVVAKPAKVLVDDDDDADTDDVEVDFIKSVEVYKEALGVYYAGQIACNDVSRPVRLDDQNRAKITGNADNYIYCFYITDHAGKRHRTADWVYKDAKAPFVRIGQMPTGVSVNVSEAGGIAGVSYVLLRGHNINDQLAEINAALAEGDTPRTIEHLCQDIAENSSHIYREASLHAHDLPAHKFLVVADDFYQGLTFAVSATDAAGNTSYACRYFPAATD